MWRILLLPAFACLFSCSTTKQNGGDNNVVIVRSKNTKHAGAGGGASVIEGRNNLIEINYDSSSYTGKNNGGLTVLKGDGNHIIVDQKNVNDMSENRSDTLIIKANNEKIIMDAENLTDSSKNTSSKIEIDLTKKSVPADEAKKQEIKQAEKKPVKETNKTEQKESEKTEQAKVNKSNRTGPNIAAQKANRNGNISSGAIVEPVYEKLDELREDSRDFISDSAMIHVGGKEGMMKVSEAFEYYHELIKQGDPKGYYQIGVFYQAGIGTPVNSLKAVDYMEIAARKGISEAQYDLGFIYEEGFFKVEANKEKAIYYYRMAAAQGNKDAISRLKEVDQ